MTRTTSVKNKKQRYNKLAKFESTTNLNIDDYRAKNSKIIGCVDEIDDKLYNSKNSKQQE